MEYNASGLPSEQAGNVEINFQMNILAALTILYKPEFCNFLFFCLKVLVMPKDFRYTGSGSTRLSQN